MNIDIITFCESVHNYDGKLVIVGTFNNLNADQFPTIPRDFSFALSISFDPSECGQYKGSLKIYKKDKPEMELVNTDMPLDIKRSDAGRKSFANLSGSLVGIAIPEPGTYVASFEVGTLKREIDLYVNENPSVASSEVKPV